MLSKLGQVFLYQLSLTHNKIQSIIASYDINDKAKLIMELDQIKYSLLIDIIESVTELNKNNCE